MDGWAAAYLFNVNAFAAPTSLAQVLDLALRANGVEWVRDAGLLRLTLDDLQADLRTVVEVRPERLAVEVRQLQGYNPARDLWSGYVGEPRRLTLENRRGLKALMQWLESVALAKYRCANPAMVARYRPA